MIPMISALDHKFALIYEAVAEHVAYSKFRYELIGRKLVLQAEENPEPELIVEVDELLFEAQVSIQKTQAKVDQARNAYDACLIGQTASENAAGPRNAN